ncbi:MAG: hypothetical protein RMJ66_02830 [Bacteroidia bacterium]|nr:hypothetical protein [Bacteroidia bacterium]MDW8133981.1 hypothetical protein [Bacteroidia bacterium]
MEIELLWPLIQDLIQGPQVAEEDWVFLRQNADTLGCPEAVLRAIVQARLASGQTEILPKVQALSALIESLGAEANRKISFIVEVAQYLGLPIDLGQVLVQVPRSPALRYLVRLLKAVEMVGDRSILSGWVEAQAASLHFSKDVVEALTHLLEAAKEKSLQKALESYWTILNALQKQGMPAVEMAYLMDLAREARLADPISQGLQEYLRMRHRGTSSLESLAYLVRSFIQKGVLSEEELPFLRKIAEEEGIHEAVLQGIIELENTQRRSTTIGFGAEMLQPLIRALISTKQMNEAALRLLSQRGNEVGVSRASLEALIELESQILEKKAKFPQSLQPLIRTLVENATISDDKLIYLIKKAQEMGGSDKVVRSLVQIEITAQKKAQQEKPFLAALPPSSPPPPEPPKVEEKVSSIPPPSESAPPPTPPKTPLQTSVSHTSKSLTFPSGGHFPLLAADFHFMKIFSLRNEKDIVRRAEIFAKEGRIIWYAFLEYGEREYVLVVKGRPEHRFEEVVGWAISPTGEVIAVKHRSQGNYRVYLNGEEGRPLEEISNLVLSPNHNHLAYIGRKGEEFFVFMDNIGMGPFIQVGNLVFRPGTENELFFTYQVEKNKWLIRDYLNNTYGEPAASIDHLTFSPDGRRMVYAILKNRKFYLREGNQIGEPFDLISDVRFTEDSRHLVYLIQKGMQRGITWDHEVLLMGEGVSSVTLSPDSRFVAYTVREKDQHFLCIHKKQLGPYERVERPFITRTKPSVIYPAVLQGRSYIFVNGAPEGGPFDTILKFTGRGDSYAAFVKKGTEGQAVMHNGKIGSTYSTVDQPTWDSTGKNLAYIARKKGGWSGVVWNETESDQYDFVQHLTFNSEGKALLFFARRRDGWYAVLNDKPLPETLCHEILSAPVYDEKSKTFYYLYRQGKDLYEGRITLT